MMILKVTLILKRLKKTWVAFRVILEVTFVSFLCPSNNDVAFKITIWSKLNSDQLQDRMVILKVTSFLEGHKNDKRVTSNITRNIPLIPLKNVKSMSDGKKGSRHKGGCYVYSYC